MRDVLIYYCGHGSFLRDRTYFLTLAGTRRGFEASTGFKLRELRHDLENRLLDRRLHVVLDCCYAGEAVKEFMGPSIERAVEGGVRMGCRATAGRCSRHRRRTVRRSHQEGRS